MSRLARRPCRAPLSSSHAGSRWRNPSGRSRGSRPAPRPRGTRWAVPRHRSNAAGQIRCAPPPARDRAQRARCCWRSTHTSRPSRRPAPIPRPRRYRPPARPRRRRPSVGRACGGAVPDAIPRPPARSVAGRARSRPPPRRSMARDRALGPRGSAGSGRSSGVQGLRLGTPLKPQASSPCNGFAAALSGNTAASSLCSSARRWSRSSPLRTARRSAVGFRSRFS